MRKIADWLASHNPRVPPGMHVMKLSYGTFLLDHSSLVDRYLIKHGSWEKRQLERMTQAFRAAPTLDDAVFLDIGAYWGLYAIQAQKHGIPEVHVFEPDPKNRAQLYAQLFLNNLETAITVHPYAAYNREGTISFSRSNDIANGNRGGAGIDRNEAADFAVPCQKIDSLFDYKDKFVFCKLDVESAELEALDGMKDLIANNKVFLQVETFPKNIAAYREHIQSLGLRFLERIEIDDYYQNY